jgi:hypothetical protein
MLHTLADRGACELLGVTVSKEHPSAAAFVDAVNTFYGRPDVPVGVARQAPHRESKYLDLVNRKEGEAFRYPHDIGVSAEPMDAVSLIKQVLKEAEDGSVAIIQVGLAVNMADLLQDPEGKALVRRKVDHLSVMAGAFTSINGNNHYLEANVRNHVASMKLLADQWPVEVPVIWSGFSVGITVPFPRTSIQEDFNYLEHHPVKEAYLLHSGPNHDRPTWDLTAVLHAVYPDRGYFKLSPLGKVTVAGDGFTRFLPPPSEPRGDDKPGRDQYLMMDPVQAERVRQALVQLTSEPVGR